MGGCPASADAGLPRRLVDHRGAGAVGDRDPRGARRRTGPPSTVDGTQVTLTPQTRGDHWYQIHAGDGSNLRDEFNLALPAFDPALKRDDSHALLLYRFDEGTGNVIHDHAAVASPPRSNYSRRRRTRNGCPGAVSRCMGRPLIPSSAPAAKLMALATAQGLHHRSLGQRRYPVPPLARVGCLLSWETRAGQQNFSVLHQFLAGPTYLSTLTIAPPGTSLSIIAASPHPLRLNGFPTGLCHVVITWDGRQTTAYSNGVRSGPGRGCRQDDAGAGYLTADTGPQPLAWHPEGWTPTPTCCWAP